MVNSKEDSKVILTRNDYLMKIAGSGLSSGKHLAGLRRLKIQSATAEPLFLIYL
jgi:hypothetical protein